MLRTKYLMIGFTYYSIHTFTVFAIFQYIQIFTIVLISVVKTELLQSDANYHFGKTMFCKSNS